MCRLSGKRNVPNVAVRKQEFEERVGREEKSVNQNCRESREGRSLEAGSPPMLPMSASSLSGNRTVIVGSKHLHVEPPVDFRQLSAGISIYFSTNFRVMG